MSSVFLNFHIFIPVHLLRRFHDLQVSRSLYAFSPPCKGNFIRFHYGSAINYKYKIKNLYINNYWIDPIKKSLYRYR